MDEMTFYKVLNKDGTCYHGGKGAWPLPTRNEDGTWTPGKWMPALEGDLVPCEHGYRVVTLDQLLSWASPAVFEVEVADCERLASDNKWVVRGPCRLVRRMPIGEREWRLLACDYAERVVHLCGDDLRPANTISVVRRYANGKATETELIAAWDTVNDSPGDLARDPVRAAARLPKRSHAETVARTTRRIVARAASRAAARNAAEGATEAAWDAAKAVAWVATEGAWGGAAWDAALATERTWQMARLREYLEG